MLTNVEKPDSKPQFCQYSDGPCDQDFTPATHSDAFFVYPASPISTSSTIDAAIADIQVRAGNRRWVTWKKLDIPGQIIFCEICRTMRFAKFLVADVTTLNFNLMFEIGYALGLGIPVLPIRNVANVSDRHIFDELGVLDTLGYFDYQNSAELSRRILEGPPPVIGLQRPALNIEAPLYVVKSPVDSDGLIKMFSVIKKSRLRFRSFDTKELGRVSLHEIYKNTLSSYGLFLHLLDPSFRGATVHNARCAFIAGLGMASQKRVVLLQQGNVQQPIDYRDVVLHYTQPKQIPDFLIPPLGQVIEQIQTTRFVPTALPVTPLEKIDLGDLAAENEIRALDSYFVPTAQYQKAKQGHARLVVGRKGAGKSALFYSLRSTFRPVKSHLVLDLRPEGHQFTKLREMVLIGMSLGFQQHLLAAFWNYLLTYELGFQIAKNEKIIKDARLRESYEKIRSFFDDESINDSEPADFSERLLKLVSSIAERRQKQNDESMRQIDITDLVHTQHIRNLNDAITEYLSITRRDVWILFDNLDKAWPVQAVRWEDIALLRALLEASRKLQRQFESRAIDLYSVVFIRSDIYQHLVLEPAERGKETAAVLDWSDPEVFKDLLARRIAPNAEEVGFDAIWAKFFPAHVRGEDSFQYILNRTLMRPRDLLRFVRECVDVGINRRRHKILEEDVLQAEVAYSADALVDVNLEMKDIKAEYENAAYSFIGSPIVISEQDVLKRLAEAGMPNDQLIKILDLLVWFGVIGIYVSEDEERYSYQFDHDPLRMRIGLKNFAYCIHPAFRKALGCTV